MFPLILFFTAGYLVENYPAVKNKIKGKRMTHHDTSTESSSDHCVPNPCRKDCDCCKKPYSDLGHKYEVSSISCDGSSSSSGCENAYDELCKSDRMDSCPKLGGKGEKCYDSSSSSSEDKDCKSYKKHHKKKNWVKELCGDDCHPYSSSSSSSESECPDCRVWQPCIACSKKKKHYHEKEKPKNPCKNDPCEKGCSQGCHQGCKSCYHRRDKCQKCHRCKKSFEHCECKPAHHGKCYRCKKDYKSCECKPAHHGGQHGGYGKGKGKVYKVTFGSKSHHPWSNRIVSTDKALYVNGNAGKTLHLTVGHYYIFDVDQKIGSNGKCSDSFYFTKDPQGGSKGEACDDVGYDPVKLSGSPNPVENGKMFLYVTRNMPKTFYYHSKCNRNMGGLVILHEVYS